MTETLSKPFKTIDEQIELLNSRGLQTDDATRGILEREGYYPVINGYKDLFLDNDASRSAGSDVYRSDASFDDIHRLFVFDRDLRATFMRYFAMAEAALKTVCAYQFTSRHPSEKNPYMNLENYSSKARCDKMAGKLISDFAKAIGKDSKHREWQRKPYLKHYIEDHDGEVPLWVLMNFATLSQAFKFYCFMDESMQNSIAKVFSGLYRDSYGKSKKIYPRDLRLAYDHIKDFRNICAHDERLYCARVSKSADTPIARVIEDLGLVLPKERYEELNNEVERLVKTVIDEIDLLDDGFVEVLGFDRTSWGARVH